MTSGASAHKQNSMAAWPTPGAATLAGALRTGPAQTSQNQVGRSWGGEDALDRIGNTVGPRRVLPVPMRVEAPTCCQ